MKLGIINTGCQRKKSIFNLFKRKIVENKYEFKNLIVYEKNVYLNKNKLEKNINHIEYKLSGQVDLIYRENNKIKDFFLNLCILLYEKIINKEKFKPYKLKVLIYDGELSVLNKQVLEKLCFMLSECHIISKRREAVSKLCDYMKKNYGATYRICDEPEFFKYDAVIDLDNLSFRMRRNIYINDFDFDFSDIENQINIKQISLASFLYYSGCKVEFKEIKGRKAYFELEL